MDQYEVVPALRDAIESQRKRLGLSPGALAVAANVTPQGLMSLRKGYRKQYQERLTAGVCRALGWTTDSIDRILAGGEPQLVEQPADGHLNGLEEQISSLLVEVARLARVVRQQGEQLAALTDAVTAQANERASRRA
jgi:hypothetical protein